MLYIFNLKQLNFQHFLFCWSEVEIRGKFFFDSRLGPIGPQDTPYYRFDSLAFLSAKFV